MTIDPHLKENDSDYILISHDNLAKFGFACFHQHGDCNIKDGFWAREVEISVGGSQGNLVQKFKIPEEHCIELSPTEKIVASDNFEIKDSADSQDTIASLLQRAGWNQTRADLDAMQSHCQDGIFIASYNFHNQKIPLGSGVSLPVSDDHAWIGMILVHPELRRQGIARSIMNACLEHARLVQGKSIIGLDATPLGKQVYHSLGFKDSFTIWRSHISTNIKSTDVLGHGLESLNLESLKVYLGKKDYTERWSIIKLLNEIPGSKSIMARTSDGIKGFIMSRPGRLNPFIGPLIADSHEVALLLMQHMMNYWKELRYEKVFMDIPEYHLKDSIFIHQEKSSNSIDHQISVKPVRSLIRMYQLVADNELKENSSDLQNLKLSTSDLALKKAQDCHDVTAAFMKKEKQDVVPIMFGTSGPEWS